MKRLLIPALIALAAGCSDNNSNSNPRPDETTPPEPEPVVNAIFEVGVVNLTNGQPLSPIALALHDDSFAAFAVGAPASAGLELLAEGGDNSQLLEEVEGRVEASGEAPLGPGGEETFVLELDGDDVSDLHLSVVSMLVNTNDAFTALNGVDVSAMEVGDTWMVNAVAYDAGTEADSEAAGTIPGPADGGEGFNAARDDAADQVTMHSGVVTSDDGLPTSVLTQMHRFDNPVARFTVTRTQ
ncbi:hypothetical protein E4634_02220 [Mangrovimicrobium sediminis]|uniref:Uncharacterized protein n=1 Tax=Mangrovimicrobium sediminis TaxID=2562682 RepID=A0A4Z0M8J7_9GAMM|nr:spondin domain-containing protein [Haliea sp. SAOS-164]TGD75716.1 hypothetical protein E4634_02220 [Haliea sp. SAOS-164]